MDSLQQALSVFSVLGLLAATLWWLRRKGWTAASAPRNRGRRNLELIEKLPLTPQHSLHLVRIAGRAVLIAVSPSGCVLLDNQEVGAYPELARQAGETGPP